MSEGFVQFGNTDTDLEGLHEEFDDYLVADRVGLEHLKTQIELVLDGHDVVTLSEDSVFEDLDGIRIATRTQPKPVEKGGISDIILIFFLIAVLVLVLFVFLLGILEGIQLVTSMLG